MSSVRPTHVQPSLHVVDGATDEYENFNSPVSAATSFLFSIASNRTKSTFLPILAFVNRVLQSYGSRTCIMVNGVLTISQEACKPPALRCAQHDRGVGSVHHAPS